MSELSADESVNETLMKNTRSESFNIFERSLEGPSSLIPKARNLGKGRM